MLHTAYDRNTSETTTTLLAAEGGKLDILLSILSILRGDARTLKHSCGVSGGGATSEVTQ